MPAKKAPLSSDEQRKMFEAEVERLIAAGELSRTEADAKLDNLVKRSKGRAPGDVRG